MAASFRSRLHSFVADERIRSFLTGGFWLFCAKFVTAAAMFAITALAARMLPAASMGIFVLIVGLITTFSRVGSVGANFAAVRFIAEAMHTDRQDSVRVIVNRTFAVSILATAALVVMIAGFPGPQLVGSFLSADVTIAATSALAAGIAFGVFRTLIYDCFRGLGDMRKGAWFDGAISNGLAACALFVLWSLARPIGLEMVLLTVVGTAGISAALGIAFLYCEIERLPSGHPASAPSVGGLITVGVAQMIATTISNLTPQIALWTMTLVGSLDEVAAFGVALRVMMAVSVLFIISNQVFAPLIAAMNIRGEKAALDAIVRSLNSVLTLVALVVSLPFLLFPDEILRICFGAAYASAGPSLIMLTLAQLVNSITGPAQMVLRMTGNERYQLVITVVVLLLQIGATLPLTLWFGLEGAAAATAGAMALRSALACWMAQRITGIRTLPILNPRRVHKLLRARH